MKFRNWPGGGFRSAGIPASRSALMAVVLGLTMASPNWATFIRVPEDLPTAQYSISLTTSTGAVVTGNTPGGYAISCNPQASLQDSVPPCASVDVSLAPNVTISSSVRAFPFDSAGTSATANYATSASVSAAVAYYYAVTGPESLAPIPVQLNGIMSCNYTAGTFSRVSVSVGAQLRGVDVFGQPSIKVASCDERRLDGPYQLQTFAFVGTANVIQLGTFFQISNDGSVTNNNTPGVFIGSVDPVVSFAPGFDSTGYSIIVNSGFSNSAAAPEPGTLGMVAGVGLLAGLLRRRKVSRNRLPGEGL